MLRLVAFFFGGLVLANVVIVAFETARSAVSNRQVSANVEQKPSGDTPQKSAPVADATPPVAADSGTARRLDWVHSERFNAHAGVREPVYPQWLRTQ